YRLDDAKSIRARVSSAGVGGFIEVRAGSPTGTLLGKVTVPVTGGWETFIDVHAPLSGALAETTTLYLVFTGGSGALFDVDEFTLSTEPPGANPVIGPIVGPGGLCVDVDNANSANGTKVQLYTCNNTGAQIWTFDGPTIRALGKCLDVAGGDTADGTRVQIWECNNTGAQNWTVEQDGSLKNPQSGRCLDGSDAAQLVIRTCDGSANQKF